MEMKLALEQEQEDYKTELTYVRNKEYFWVYIISTLTRAAHHGGVDRQKSMA
jgi:hypothetical protein